MQNIKFKKFELESDLVILEDYLRKEYLKNKNLVSLLPQRLHEQIYKHDDDDFCETGQKSSDYISLIYDEQKLIGYIIPTAGYAYTHLASGYEGLYRDLLKYMDDSLGPLCKDSSWFEFWIIEHGCLSYKHKILEELGYGSIWEDDTRYSYISPQEYDASIAIPEGFKLLYGEDCDDEIKKYYAFCLGEQTHLEGHDYQFRMDLYYLRKQSSLYPDSFECMVSDLNSTDKNDIASYCFVYIDKKTKTAYIESASIRKRYRKEAIGRAMMQGVIKRCKEQGIERCYIERGGIDFHDLEKYFYNTVDFVTEDTFISYWGLGEDRSNVCCSCSK